MCEDKQIVKNNYKTTNKYIDMKSLPKEFQLGVSLMARNLRKEVAEVSLIRNKEYVDFVKDKHNIMKISDELNEALNYWLKKNKKIKSVLIYDLLCNECITKIRGCSCETNEVEIIDKVRVGWKNEM